jgi:hypothetical protein
MGALDPMAYSATLSRCLQPGARVDAAHSTIGTAALPIDEVIIPACREDSRICRLRTPPALTSQACAFVVARVTIAKQWH